MRGEGKAKSDDDEGQYSQQKDREATDGASHDQPHDTRDGGMGHRNVVVMFEGEGNVAYI